MGSYSAGGTGGGASGFGETDYNSSSGLSVGVISEFGASYKGWGVYGAKERVVNIGTGRVRGQDLCSSTSWDRPLKEKAPSNKDVDVLL